MTLEVCPGKNERIDQFGEFLLLLRCGDGAAVAVGTPGETVGKVDDAGTVTVVPLGSGGTCRSASYDGRDFGGRVQEAAWVGQGLGGARAASGAHDDLLARTEKSDVGLIGLVGRIDPTTGRRVATYTTNWGSSLITGFGNAAR